MNQWLNYHHLLYFYTIATEGSIAKAAKKLRLGQPTLSTQLKQFEESLGQELFERKLQRLHLTEAGTVAMRYAGEIFALGGEMLDTMNDRKGSKKIAAQIGAMDAVPKELLGLLVSSAKSAFDCTLSVMEGPSPDLLRDLAAHHLDLVIMNHPPPVTAKQGYETRCLAKLPVFVWGTKEYAKLKRLYPSSLAGQSFIMPHGSSKLRHDIDDYLKGLNIDVNIACETQDASLGRLLLQQGLGVAAMTEIGATIGSPEGNLVKIGALPGVTEDIWMVCGERRWENPVARHIMTHFQLKQQTLAYR